MNILFQSVGLLLAACPLVFASDNGGYYTCDAETLASDNQCIFDLTGTQPAEWVDIQPHNIDSTVGDNFYRGVQSYTGDMLSLRPTPWVNGDVLVGTAPDTVTGDDWSGYTLIFELIAPLRDMMMYDPDALDAATWAIWTRALTDCNSKTEDYVTSRGGGTPFSTSQVYDYIKNPENKDIHHYILQYLEEGAVDLVCLSTDLSMYDEETGIDHCEVIRETAKATTGVDRCNCWFDAYEAIYGACPVVDMTFTTCGGTVAPTVCTDVVAVDTSTLGEDETDKGTGGDQGTPGGKPAGKPGRR